MLMPLVSHPIALFFLAMVTCTALEYVASFAMEKLFGTLFWDYSNKPLNLQGRICLQYALDWGLLGLLLIYVLDPSTVRMVTSWPLPGAFYTLVVLILLTTVSAVSTLLAFRRFDQKVAYLKAQRDGRRLPTSTPRSAGWSTGGARGGDDQHLSADESHRGVPGADGEASPTDRGRPASRHADGAVPQGRRGDGAG